MKTNDEVISCFINGIETTNRNLFVGTNANRLYSYSTCICQKVGDKYYYNATRYSNSTSKHQSSLRRQLEQKNIDFVVVKDVPINTKDLYNFAKEHEQAN